MVDDLHRRVATLEARHEADFALRAEFREVVTTRLNQLEHDVAALKTDLQANTVATRDVVLILEGAREAFAFAAGCGRFARRVARWVLPFVALAGSIMAAIGAYKGLHK